ncbi:MAG: 3-hydroxyacyl-CoA dehydrogenase NAD-binding domain-containing protein [Thermodesulfobacteriota bacterium]
MDVTYTLDRQAMVAVVTIDTDGPVNTIGQQFIMDLEKITAQACEDAIRGMIIVSAKKKSFLDGANLREIALGASLPAIRSVVTRYQEVLKGLAKAPFPVVAMLDGQSALGGGFELLLWSCDHVFATADCKMGLPETNVGLFPAGGGTRTLRNVVGFKTAVDMITTARVSQAQAFANPAFLTTCPAGELKPRALECLRELHGKPNRNHDPNYREPDPVSPDEQRIVLNKARARYTLCPQRPYLAAVLDVIESGLNLAFEDAVVGEVDRFVALFADPNSRNKIDLFFLVSSVGPKLAKVNPARGVAAKKIAVIGTGLMGRGIAQVAADKGIETLLIDVNLETTQAAAAEVDRTLQDLVEKGRWTKDRKDALTARLRCTADYGDLKDVPLVIECVFEDLSLKRRILQQVQEANPEAIFASNTSTLPMADISEGSARPQQVVGMHFFSPVPLMPLLEVIRGPRSSESAVTTAVTVGRTLGKTVILVSDGPGFYTSRTFGAYVMNGFRLAELGLSPWDVDFAAMQAGFPQGPLHVYGTAGGNVIFHASSFMSERFPERVRVPESLAKLHAAGYVGAGKPSFYLDDKKLIRDESVLPHIVAGQGLPVPTYQEAQDILLLGMVNEAFWCLSEGVLQDYFSMDLGAVLGIGFPDCWHGPARYVSLKGVKATKARLEELADKFRLPGLAPAPEFDRLIACGLDRALI